MNRGYINNQAASVLNVVDLVDNSQTLSADNLPIGLREAQIKSEGGNYSANFGTDRDGQPGRCIFYDGSSVDIQSKNISTAGTLSGLIEISAYFKTSSALTGLLSIFSADDGASNRHWQLTVSNTGVYFNIIDNIVGITGSFDDQKWHYVRAFIDSNDVTNYGIQVDDTTVVDASNTFDIRDRDNVLLTFQKLFTSSNKFTGSVSHMLITDDNGIKASFDCETGSDDILIDNSGFNNNATILNLYSGFHTTDNLITKSHLNDEGYSGGNGSIDTTNLTTGESWKEYAVDELTIDSTQPYVISGIFGDVLSTDYYAEHQIQTSDGDGTTIQFLFLQNSLASYGAINFRVGNASGDQIKVSLTSLNTIISSGDTYSVEFLGGDRTVLTNYVFKYNKVEVSGITTGAFARNTTQTKIWDKATVSHNFIGEFSLNINNEVLLRQFDKFIPKDQSVTLPPFKDVLGNDLQFIGKCPSRAKFVDSPCFHGDVSGWFTAGDLSSLELQNIEIKFYAIFISDSTRRRPFSVQGQSGEGFDMILQSAAGAAGEMNFRTDLGLEVVNTPVLPRDEIFLLSIKVYNSNVVITVIDNEGIISSTSGTIGTIQYNGGGNTSIGALWSSGLNPILSGDKMFDVIINELDSSGNYVSTLVYYPMCPFGIPDPANYTEFDVVGGNHATLINGSTANEGTATRPNGDYGQLGFGRNGRFVNEYFISTQPSGVNYGKVSSIEWYMEESQSAVLQGIAGLAPINDYSVGAWLIDISSSRVRVWIPTVEGDSNEAELHQFAQNNAGKYRVDIDTSVVGTGIIRLYYNDVEVPPYSTSTKTTRNFDLQMPVGEGLDIGRRPSQSYPLIRVLRYFKISNSALDLDMQDTYNGIDRLGNYNFVAPNGNPEEIIIPALATDITKDALGNPLTLLQDGESFLNTGTKLQHLPMPRVVQSDAINMGSILFAAADGAPINQEFSAYEANVDDTMFTDVSETGKVKNNRIFKQPLTGRQLNTELKITNND